MKNKIIAVMLVVVTTMSLVGCSKENIAEKMPEPVKKLLVEEEPEAPDPTEPDTGVDTWSGMLSGMLYVRHNGKYYPCDIYDASFDTTDKPAERVEYNRTIRYVGDKFDHIPTLYEGDALIYYLDNEVMPSSITWERYCSDGWTLGITNLTDKGNGKFAVALGEEISNLATESDASAIETEFNIEEVIVDTVSKNYVTPAIVKEDCGIITGLKKGTSYKTHIYNGTIFNDYELTADTYVFNAMELYKTNKYRFLENNLAEIYLPEELSTGYYYVNNIGLFRYVKEGRDYDEKTEFNAPYLMAEDEWGPPMLDLTVEEIPEEEVVDKIAAEYATSINNSVYVPKGTKHIKIVVKYESVSDVGDELIPIGYFNDQSMFQDIDVQELVYEGASPGVGFHSLKLSNMQGHNYTIEYTFN